MLFMEENTMGTEQSAKGLNVEIQTAYFQAEQSIESIPVVKRDLKESLPERYADLEFHKPICH